MLAGPRGPRLLVVAALAACTGREPAPTIFASDCETCHLQDYERTTDPPHIDLYPPRCVACHLTDAFAPDDNSRHDELFPIFRGEHQGLSCDECHVPPDDFFGVSCIECHEHAEAPMSREHRGNAGYRWETEACLGCHPEGGG